MGILDDAIREHLDLKRKHGAEEDEVQILEEEAFGLPSRPGDPDFPDRPPTGEQQIVEEAPTGAEEPVASEAPAVAEEPVAERPVAEIEEPPAPPAEDLAGFYDQASDAPAVGEPTEEHPAPLPPEDEAPPAEPLSAEAPAEPGQEAESGEFEIGEIELELDDEFEEFRETDDEPAAAAPAEPAVEPDLGTPVSDESDEFAAVELDRADEDAEEKAEPAEEGEDVLEETPEFLRDTPEDERLWFEQGEPKDFDFDEEEEEGEER